MPNLVAALAEALDEAGASLEQAGKSLRTAGAILAKEGGEICAVKTRVDALLQASPEVRRRVAPVVARVEARYRKRIKTAAAAARKRKTAKARRGKR